MTYEWSLFSKWEIQIPDILVLSKTQLYLKFIFNFFRRKFFCFEYMCAFKIENEKYFRIDLTFIFLI